MIVPRPGSGAALSAAGRTVSTAGSVITNAAADLVAVPGAVWRGQGAAAQRVVRDDLLSLAAVVADDLAAMASVLASLATAVDEATAQVLAGQGLAATAGLLLASDGTPQPTLVPPDPGADPLAAGAGRAQVLAAATGLEATDAAAARALAEVLSRGGDRLGSGSSEVRAFGGVLAVRVTVPAPPSGGVLQVASWWAALLPGQRIAMIRRLPQLVGRLEGVPSADRDAANRTLLRLAQVATTAALASLHPPRARGRGPGLAVLAARRRVLISRVDALRALDRTLTVPGRRLLALDPLGDGRAIVALGDLERAQSIGVLVPGMGNELGDLPDVVADAGTVAGAAGPGTVTVAWLGYDSPRVRQVASSDLAVDGARQLDADIRGWHAARYVGPGSAGPQRLTLVGHSYGSLVVGLAAARGAPVSDVAVVGSPGTAARRAGDLPEGSSHVWAARAKDDPIRLVFDVPRLGGVPGRLGLVHRWFGPDPSRPAFGGQRFLVGPGVTGHVRYFEPGTTSVANLGRIVAGRYSDVSR